MNFGFYNGFTKNMDFVFIRSRIVLLFGIKDLNGQWFIFIANHHKVLVRVKGNHETLGVQSAIIFLIISRINRINTEKKYPH